MQDYFGAISSLGFPVVVAGYLLFRMENKMEKITDAIEGKPSERKKGLINTIEQNTKVTKELVRMINKRIGKL